MIMWYREEITQAFTRFRAFTKTSAHYAVHDVLLLFATLFTHDHTD